MKIFSQKVLTKDNFKKFMSLTFVDKVFILLELLVKYLQKKMNFKGKYKLYVNNIKNHENLLIVLAGYQDYTRENVFNRVKKYTEVPMDVCIITPGKHVLELENICKSNNWSYLVTKENKCSLGLNLAISLHKKAEFIYKIDEDIFITKGLFKNLRNKYDYVQKRTDYIPGGIAPVINLNNFSINYFLKILGKQKEFFELFPNFKQQISVQGCNIWYSQEIVKYIRENIKNIDDIQENFFKDQDIYGKDLKVNGIRFTIGCFLFPRKIWEDMGGFDTNVEGILGMDETSYLDFCINNSYPIILCENSLVGHLSFGPQKKVMKEYFENNKTLFSIK